MEQFILKTIGSDLVTRNGQQVVVVAHITEPDEKFDAEVLPMVKVQFPDGFQTAVWQDELQAV